MAEKKIRVLVIDDSAMARQMIVKGLSVFQDIEVIDVAGDVYAARDLIVNAKPDVLTLDVEMPKMDGVEFLRHLMPQYPIPVVMVSALTGPSVGVTLDALDAGAVDYVLKPSSSFGYGLKDMMVELGGKIRVAAATDVRHFRNRVMKDSGSKSRVLAKSTDKVIAIGASTGGTVALKGILEQLPADMPGIVVVQHMPPTFTKLFAERLNSSCAMEVQEASHGERILRGRVLIAPGAMQMSVYRSGGYYRVSCQKGEKVNGHCPSVGVLFDSVVESAGANALGVILTGMGTDGAKELLRLRRAGAYTIGQDEKSSVVYGMPKEAFVIGAVMEQLPLTHIAGAMCNAVERMQE